MKRSDFVESGREGGKIAASHMTPKQRSERARKAALAKASRQSREGESMRKPNKIRVFKRGGKGHGCFATAKR